MANLTYGTFFMVTLFLASCIAAPSNKNYDIEIPEECKYTQGFCAFKPKGYDKIARRVEELLPSYPVKLQPQDSIGKRISINDKENCPSKHVTEPVYIYKYKDSDEMDIIVQTDKFEQTITQTLCNYSEIDMEGNEDHQCFQRVGLGDFLTFKCKETMSSRTLLIFDGKTDKIKTGSYNISVCCSCQADIKSK